MTKSYDLLGACGLYCGACYHYRSSYPESRHLIDQAYEQGRDTTGWTCSGCRSDKLYIHKGCSECAIRDCAESKGLNHCGECSDFPCSRLANFQHDGRPHHVDVVKNAEQMNEMGHEAWLEGQEIRWRCSCGQPYSWYEGKCAVCGSKLNAYDT